MVPNRSRRSSRLCRPRSECCSCGLCRNTGCRGIVCSTWMRWRCASCQWLIVLFTSRDPTQEYVRAEEDWVCVLDCTPQHVAADVVAAVRDQLPHCHLAASTGPFSSPKTRNGPLCWAPFFGRKMPPLRGPEDRNFDAGARFPALFLVWAPSFSEKKKKLKCEFTKES